MNKNMSAKSYLDLFKSENEGTLGFGGNQNGGVMSKSIGTTDHKQG
jgi:hypothetical protein